MTDIDIKNFSSKALAAHVVVYRLLGLNKDLATKCMIELSNRKAAGDEFDYDAYITDELKKSPKPYLEKEEKSALMTLLNLKLDK